MTAAVLQVPLNKRAPKRVLPGFRLTLGYTLFYLALIVLLPLSALIFKTFTLTLDQFWAAVASPRVVASYQLTFGASFIAALVNAVFGLLIAWVLVRYQFPGKKIIDAHHGKISVKNYFASDTENIDESEILGAQIDILFLNVTQNNNSSAAPRLL